MLITRQSAFLTVCCFIQELLSLGITAEVMSPKKLRKEISRIDKTVWKLNG